jgi:hypothetical protein
MINDKHLSLSCRMSMGTAVVYLYHPRCGIQRVHFEACGEDKSPGRAAITVRLLQKSIVLIKNPGGAAITVRLLQQV